MSRKIQLDLFDQISMKKKMHNSRQKQEGKYGMWQSRLRGHKPSEISQNLF